MNFNLTRRHSAPARISSELVDRSGVVPGAIDIPTRQDNPQVLPPTSRTLQRAGAVRRPGPGHLPSAHSFAFYGHSIFHFYPCLQSTLSNPSVAVQAIRSLDMRQISLQASATEETVESPAKIAKVAKKPTPSRSRRGSEELIFHFEPEIDKHAHHPELEMVEGERKQDSRSSRKRLPSKQNRIIAQHKMIASKRIADRLADPLIVLNESQPPRPLSDMFDEPLFGLFRRCYPNGEINLTEFGKLAPRAAQELTKSLKFSTIFGHLNPNKMNDFNELLADPFMRQFIYKNPVAITLLFNGLTIVALRNKSVQDSIKSGELTFAKLKQIDDLESAGRKNRFTCFTR